MRGSAGHRACKEEGGARIEGGPQCSHHSYPMAPSTAAFTLAAVWMCCSSSSSSLAGLCKLLRTLVCVRAAGKVQVKMQAIRAHISTPALHLPIDRRSILSPGHGPSPNTAVADMHARDGRSTDLDLISLMNLSPLPALLVAVVA